MDFCAIEKYFVGYEMCVLSTVLIDNSQLCLETFSSGCDDLLGLGFQFV